jgi:RNA polymerase sigma-70 factor (ECF subfamily)
MIDIDPLCGAPPMMRSPTLEDARDVSSRDTAPRDVTEAFARHGAFVWRTLQRLGVRDADLEDVVQEVFLVVHRQLEGFDGRSRTTTWLYGISVRVASTHRRRAWVRRELPTDELPDGASSSAGPEEAYGAAEERKKLLEVLDLMDLEKRALFVMFELDEMPCEEIAMILSAPVGTVHSRLHAARREFQRALTRWHARQGRTRTPFWSFGRRP